MGPSDKFLNGSFANVRSVNRKFVNGRSEGSSTDLRKVRQQKSRQRKIRHDSSTRFPKFLHRTVCQGKPRQRKFLNKSASQEVHRQGRLPNQSFARFFNGRFIKGWFGDGRSTVKCQRKSSPAEGSSTESGQFVQKICAGRNGWPMLHRPKFADSAVVHQCCRNFTGEPVSLTLERPASSEASERRELVVTAASKSGVCETELGPAAAKKQNEGETAEDDGQRT